MPRNFHQGAQRALSTKHSGYSIRSVAKRIGIHHSYLSKLERGENAPLTEERIYALARLLGEDPEMLMALAGKLSEDTSARIRSNPAAFQEFLATLGNAPGSRPGLRTTGWPSARTNSRS